MKSNAARMYLYRGGLPQKLRLATAAPESPKYDVHAITHRRPLKYLGKTMLHASIVAEMVMRHSDYATIRNVIWAAVDDARTAGFQAGCAYMRSR